MNIIKIILGTALAYIKLRTSPNKRSYCPQHYIRYCGLFLF